MYSQDVHGNSLKMAQNVARAKVNTLTAMCRVQTNALEASGLSFKRYLLSLSRSN